MRLVMSIVAATLGSLLGAAARAGVDTADRTVRAGQPPKSVMLNASLTAGLLGGLLGATLGGPGRAFWLGAVLGAAGADRLDAAILGRFGIDLEQLLARAMAAAGSGTRDAAPEDAEPPLDAA